MYISEVKKGGGGEVFEFRVCSRGGLRDRSEEGVGMVFTKDKMR